MDGGTERAPGRGVKLVLAAFVALLTVRLFSEVVPLLPREATFVDVAILLALVGAAATRPRLSDEHRLPWQFTLLATAFFGIALVASLANLQRIAPAPALLFLYGFLAPLGFFYAVHRLWQAGGGDRLRRLLIAVGMLQFVVVVAIDLPKFLTIGNPDQISGTFGDNGYQLVFFLLVFASLVVSTAVFQPRRMPLPVAIAVVGASAIVIFLAQYRALLVTTFLVIPLVSLFLTRTRRASGVAAGVIALAVFVAAFAYVADRFPSTKLGAATDAITQDPMFFVDTRAAVLADVFDLYGENPRYLLTGTGPATYSSRAWRTFANTSDTRTAVAAPLARTLNQLSGGPYETDVANRYTVPRLRVGEVILGSRALTSPLSSYSSLLAEVGVLGFLAIVALYLAGLAYAWRITAATIGQRRPDDPLPALSLATVVAFAVLLQLAVLENWFEVTRVTFFAWGLLAIAAKEFATRYTEG